MKQRSEPSTGDILRFLRSFDEVVRLPGAFIKPKSLYSYAADRLEAQEREIDQLRLENEERLRFEKAVADITFPEYEKAIINGSSRSDQQVVGLLNGGRK